MAIHIKSLRTVIGAKDFTVSRSFYSDLGFTELILENNLSLFQKQDFSFYLHHYYCKEWLDNTMLLLEVGDVYETFNELKRTDLENKYVTAKILPVKEELWGKVCYVHGQEFYHLSCNS